MSSKINFKKMTPFKVVAHHVQKYGRDTTSFNYERALDAIPMSRLDVLRSALREREENYRIRYFDGSVEVPKVESTSFRVYLG